MRTLFRFALIVVVALTIAPALFADPVRPGVQYKELPPFDTTPTVTACIAFSHLAQQCKECTGSWDVNGVRTATCRNRQYHSGCTCVSHGSYCDWRGECMYH